MKRYLHTIYSSSFFLLLFSVILISCSKEKTIEYNLNELELAGSLQNRADSLYLLNHLDSAFNMFLQSNRSFKKNNKTADITYNNLKIATIYLIINDPNSAQEIITKELPNIDSKDNAFKVYIYNTLAICYSELEDHTLAIKYFNLSLNLATSADQRTILLNNIASTYIEIKEYSKGISILNELLLSETFLTNPIERARILNNLGKALFLTQPMQGLNELNQALAIRLQQSTKDDIFRSYSTITEYYISIKDFRLAHEYALKAYHISLNFKSKKDKLTALEHLIKSSTSSPLKYLTAYIELSKQISIDNQKAKNQFAKIRYDYEQHEEENTNLKIDLQHSELVSSRRRNGLLVSTLILILGCVLISFIYRKIRYRHRLEKIEQTYITETKIAKKIHDELANDVFNTLTYSQNFNLETLESKSHLIADLELIYKKARNISLQNSSIITDKTFSTHLTTLFNEYNTPSCQIIISGLDKFDFTLLDKNQKITIYRVIQELLVNMKKHSMATIVVFKFTEDKKYFKIFYSDNGVGIIQESIKTKNGLVNVENRITNIGGTLIFDSTNQLGVKYNIQFPKKNYV